MAEKTGKLHFWPYNLLFVTTIITAPRTSHAVHRVCYEKKLQKSLTTKIHDRTRLLLNTVVTAFSGSCKCCGHDTGSDLSLRIQVYLLHKEILIFYNLSVIPLTIHYYILQRQRPYSECTMGTCASSL